MAGRGKGWKKRKVLLNSVIRMPLNYTLVIYWTTTNGYRYFDCERGEGHPMTLNVLGVPRLSRIPGMPDKLRVDCIWAIDGAPRGLHEREVRRIYNVICEKLPAIVAPLELMPFESTLMDLGG